MHTLLRSFPLAVCAVLTPPVAAQTMGFGYTAGAAQSSGSSADYAVTLSVAPAQSFLSLTPGVTVTGVDFGALSFSATGRGPNSVIETVPFSFNRPLTLALNTESAVTAPESLSGTWSGERAGSSGQYFVTDLTLDGNSAVYDFGSLGTVQADFQPGTAFNDGLGGPTTIPITANLTYRVPAAVPEVSPLALLVLGTPCLAGLALRARRRRSVRIPIDA